MGIPVSYTHLDVYKRQYHDIAILYRSNYLSRSLEKALLDERIPYIIYGGTRFYERQEVKDALCYLRMVTTADDLALQRILNRPCLLYTSVLIRSGLHMKMYNVNMVNPSGHFGSYGNTHLTV